MGLGDSLRFGAGMLAGAVIAVPVFVIGLIRRRRVFHPYGTVCRAEVVALDGEVGPRLAGPAIVRLSPVFQREDAPVREHLAISLRLRRDHDPDLRVGDQDLILGSFERFSTIVKEQRDVDHGDYLANRYSTVSRWRIDGLGVGKLRALPPPAADPARAGSRIGRLDHDVAAGRARLTLVADVGGGDVPVAEVRLVERLADDGRALRISMYRRGRGIAPTGFRNGIRAIVYPVNQAARRVLGG